MKRWSQMNGFAGLKDLSSAHNILSRVNLHEPVELRSCVTNPDSSWDLCPVATPWVVKDRMSSYKRPVNGTAPRTSVLTGRGEGRSGT